MKIKKLKECPTRTLDPIVNKDGEQGVPKGLAVIDDGDHVLDVALRQLAVFQVLLLVSNGLVPVPEMHRDKGCFRRQNSAGSMHEMGILLRSEL